MKTGPSMSRCPTLRRNGIGPSPVSELRLFIYMRPPFDDIAISAASEADAWTVVLERYRASSVENLPSGGRLIPAPMISDGEITEHGG